MAAKDKMMNALKVVAQKAEQSLPKAIHEIQTSGKTRQELLELARRYEEAGFGPYTDQMKAIQNALNRNLAKQEATAAWKADKLKNAAPAVAGVTAVAASGEEANAAPVEPESKESPGLMQRVLGAISDGPMPSWNEDRPVEQPLLDPLDLIPAPNVGKFSKLRKIIGQ